MIRIVARRACFAAALVLMALPPAAPAFAWGAEGHRLVGEIGAAAFAPELPAFLRAPGAADDIGEWAREPDRSKGAGEPHDGERDPAHTVRVDDDGQVMGGPPLASLPPTREAYDTALRAVGSDQYKAGYLPYAIMDGWQQLVKDFTYWRILTAAEHHAATPARKAYYARDRMRREKQTVMDLGIWAHFVGDASQPLHVTVHLNGWGDYPDPDRYTKKKIHAFFEGAFVHRFVTYAMVRARLPAPAPDCRCSIAQRTAAYIADTHKYSEAVYRLYKDGAFSDANPRGEDFAAARIAAGAAQLRDMTLAAWRASAEGRIGYPDMVTVGDVESGRKDPYMALRGQD